jgi:hypothetical protein
VHFLNLFEMPQPRIKWVQIDPEDEPSACRSLDGRFEIAPLYIGRTRPQAFQVSDNETKRKYTSYYGLQGAKDWANKIVNPLPPAPTMQDMPEADIVKQLAMWRAAKPTITKAGKVIQSQDEIDAGIQKLVNELHRRGLT